MTKSKQQDKELTLVERDGYLILKEKETGKEYEPRVQNGDYLDLVQLIEIK